MNVYNTAQETYIYPKHETDHCAASCHEYVWVIVDVRLVGTIEGQKKTNAQRDARNYLHSHTRLTVHRTLHRRPLQRHYQHA